MKKIITILCFTFLMSSSLMAVDNIWTGSFNKYWHNAQNWSLGHIPTSTEDVVITTSGYQPVTIDFYNETCHHLSINSGATLKMQSTFTLDVTGSTTVYGILQMQDAAILDIAGNISWESGSSGTMSSNGCSINVTLNWSFKNGTNVFFDSGVVRFTGVGNSYVYTYDADSYFHLVISNKTGNLEHGSASTQPWRINSSLTISSTSILKSNCTQPMILRAYLYNTGHVQLDAGTLVMENTLGTADMYMNSGDYVNNLTISGTNTLTLGSSAAINFQVNGNLVIESGIFNPNAQTLSVRGNWDNQVGAAGFLEANSRVIFNGAGVNQTCSTETFNILEVNKPSGDVRMSGGIVTCAKYDWTAGAITVISGSFTANDLVDDGIYGSFYLYSAGTINLTNSDGYVDLNGSLYIYGGTFNVFGGTATSAWPYAANASITMSGGTLDFKNSGIDISGTGSYTLTENISAGTIRTVGEFRVYRTTFTPTGGTIELVGSNDVLVSTVAGSNLYNLKINKSAAYSTSILPDQRNDENVSDATLSNTVTVSSSPLDVKGNITIQQGVLSCGANTINVGGNWTNTVGSSGFTESTGRVVFTGTGVTSCENETFNILEINSGDVVNINGNVTCAAYEWTMSGINVTSGSTFTANDLLDNGISGITICEPGATINLTNSGTGTLVDLNGNLYNYGGTVNIYGSNSFWPSSHNAYIMMSGGVIDFKTCGITISNSTYTLSENINAGTIRTPNSFVCNRTDFTPTAGTFEFYGTTNSNLTMNAGSLFNLTINKGTVNTLALITNATVNGALTVQSGIFQANNRLLSTGDNISINNGGNLWLENGTQLKITGTKALTVNSGGTLKALGQSGNNVIITRNGMTSNHEIQVHGTISAKYATFENNYGVNIWSDATIDPLNPFDKCTFQNGTDRFLLIANNQDLVIRDVNFPTIPLAENVWKNNDAGRITFRDATGAYAGSAYEKDPYNRVDWKITQPGLWTGAISTNWHTAGNWDDLNVPTASINVTIPTSAPNMPVVSSANADCNNLYLDGTLTIQNKTLTVAGTANINGTLAMNNYLGKMEVMGDISWKDGSSANITANAYIVIYGNWIFNSGSTADLTNCSISFNGTVSKKIYTNSTTSSFGDVYISKTGGASVTLQATSTEAMRTKGFFVDLNSHFISNSSHDIIVGANFYSFSFTEMNSGSVVFNGNDHLIIPHQDAFMNNLVFNQTGTVTINQTNTDVLTVKGDLTINSGIFSPGNSIIKLGGSWYNTFGPEAFDEGTSRVIFNGTIPQFCSTEQFNILEIDKALQYFYDQTGSTISCQVYDWTQGGIWIAGSSSFYAADLADDGIYGDFVVWSNSIELHQDASQSIDLYGTLSVNGGEFKVYGGSGQSNWGTYANGILSITGGVLDFVDQGIKVQNNAPFSFTSTIAGGKIRTQKGFIVQSPGFNPTGGEVEIYGDQNANVQTENGGSFYDLTINQTSPAVRVTINSSVIKNNFTIEEGLAEVPFSKVMECRGGVIVNSGGWFAVTSGTAKMGNLSSININSGGTMTSEGYEGAPSVFTSNYPSAYYAFNINTGGDLTMYSTIVENVSEQGLFIAPGANVNNWKVFESCEFRKGKSGPNPLLTINNSQDLVIENAIFPSSPLGGQYNVRKSVNSGSVTFVGFSGAFAGESFEDDPYSRINWTTTKSLNLSSVMIEGLYDGSETMRQAFDEMGPHWPSGVADTITVELHNTSNYGTIEYTAWGVSLSTGGEAIVPVPLDKTASYYITVKHRNSIETTSALPVDFSGVAVSYSFNAPEKAYGNNLGVMIDGVSVIFTGDSNQDGIVDGTDLSDIENLATNAASGYIPEDLNGDGLVDGSDLSIAGNNAALAVGVILP